MGPEDERPAGQSRAARPAPRVGGSRGCRAPAVLPGGAAVDDHGGVSDAETFLRAENAELRRLLDKHQWAGLTPVKSAGCCPECSGASPPHGRGHRPGCAIAAILVVSTPPADYP